MTRTLFRTFLAFVVALTFGVQNAPAQCTFACPPPNPTPQPSGSDSNRNVVWYVVGGIA